MNRLRSGSLLVASAALVASCGGGSASTKVSPPSTTLTVFAASSLADAFTELVTGFESANPGINIILNVAGSSSLAAQIRDGAPVDVFASADAESMARVVTDGRTTGVPEVFATNAMTIIVNKDNPRGVVGIEDLAREDLVIVACAPEVPCGRYARAVLTNAGVEARPRSFEENVRAVVTKVSLGEADAGIVYASDVMSAGDAVTGVDIPAAVNVVARYPIVALGTGGSVSAARTFVDWVTSAVGRAVLLSHGFGPP